MWRFSVASLVLLLSAAAALADVEVRLLSAPYVREGAYAPLLVRGAGEGTHRLEGEGVMAVEWSGSADVIVPLLITQAPGRTLAVELDGNLIEIDVQPLSPRDRLILDATSAMSAAQWARLADALFPGESVQSLAAIRGPPAAFTLADAIILDAPPSREALAEWEAAGVQVISRAAAETGWQALGLDTEGPWLWTAPRAPPVGAVEPDVYSAIASWGFGRPAGERRGIMIAIIAFIALVAVALWAGRSARTQALAVITLSAAAVVAIVGWIALRPDLALRQADVRIEWDRPPALNDRWLFVRAPRDHPAETRIAFVGVTRPVGFNPSHPASLGAVLRLGADGRPAELKLSLPPGHSAAVLQRTADAREGSAFEPWARPLVRGWYRQRLGRVEIEETPERAILRPEGGQ